jgi:DNA-binding response OmpR family regulator
MKRILIVDDVPEIRRLVRLCTLHRYAVLEASSAEEALATAQSERPDLIVLDLGLPGPMDGLDLLANLRRAPETAGVRVIVLSGRGLENDTLGLPIDGYLTKPFRPDKLADAIAAVLDSTNACSN